jgi:hypothetical protein
MQHEPHPKSPGSPAPTAESLDSAALARRRALLKGLSKGGTLAAVALPVKSFAVGGFDDPKPRLQTDIHTGIQTLCTQSGQHSAVMSRSPTLPTCAGRAPRSFVDNALPPAKQLNWPAAYASLFDTLKFNELFIDASDTRLVKNILISSDTSDAAYWIAAFFNAKNDDGGTQFPYTSKEVRAQFTSDSTGSLGLVKFYKVYLSSL